MHGSVQDHRRDRQRHHQLARTQADAAALLALVRGHWSIENNLFGVRDTTFGEDAC